MVSTNKFFTPGKLTVLMDGQAGSSGKGKVGAYVCRHADNWQFACNAFMPNSGHQVHLDDVSYFYKTLNSCAHDHRKFEKLYIGPGAVISLPALNVERRDTDIPDEKLGISPMAVVVQDVDIGYEVGTHDFYGNKIDWQHGGPLAATGTTASGCAPARARRSMRRRDTLLARDVPSLKGFLCDVPGEIMERLSRGQSGLLEVAQGFQLSNLLPEFYPFTTSRNCTVSAALDDMMLPPTYAGNVILNFRTFPIRTCNDKYVCKLSGKHLTLDEVATWYAKKYIDHQDIANISDHDLETVGVRRVRGNTGGCYPDQKEITWAKVTRDSGSPTPISELSSVTRLPRRVFTFSRQNLRDAIRYNRTNGWTFLSLNFMDYVDNEMAGRRDGDRLTNYAKEWVSDHIGEYRHSLALVGTGPRVDDMIDVDGIIWG